MHCFEGHHVTTLGEITSKDGNRTEIQELDSISHVVHDGKSKASEVRSQLKNLESTSSRLSAQYNKVLFPFPFHHCTKMRLDEFLFGEALLLSILKLSFKVHSLVKTVFAQSSFYENKVLSPNLSS